MTNQLLRALLSWIGVIGIAATGYLYTAATPFPGYTALLPVISTAIVIIAGQTPQRWSFAQLSRFRPVQYTGDVSYSLYLWHWPLIIITPYAIQRSLTGVDGITLFAFSYALAAVTKRYIEDPCRNAEILTKRPPRFTLAGVAAAMVVAISVPTAGFLFERFERSGELEATERLLSENAPCIGARAIVDKCQNAELGNTLLPGLMSMKRDNKNAYQCYQTATREGKIKSCRYGPEGGYRVAITGDSHAAMLIPGFSDRAEGLGWQIDTYVGQQCTWAITQLEGSCSSYREQLSDRLSSGDYDLIIFTAFRNGRTEISGKHNIAISRANAWATAIDAGSQVIVIADNPVVPEQMIDCVAKNPDEAVAQTACIIPVSSLTEAIDPSVAAANLERRAYLIDLGEFYCSNLGCPMVIGNTIVYRDQHHLTATYAETLTPLILARIHAAISINQ